MITPETADLIVRWTARGAVLCYLLRVVIDLRLSWQMNRERIISQGRVIWTLGCILFLIHFGSAFALVHHFDHAHAYSHTARRTAEVVGLNWGGGIYVNHAFMIFWVFDTVRWWLRGTEAAYRPDWYFWTMHGVFAFMFLNATVVFGPPHWIWISCLVAILLGLAAFAGNRPADSL